MSTRESVLEPASSAVDVIAEACSHQLGEAATIIGGYADVLREAGTTDPDVLRAVDGGVDRLRRVVADMLELTRVAGRDAQHRPLALGTLIERAVAELGTDGAALRVEIARTLPGVVGDDVQLICAFRHLLRSAAAARDPGQRDVRVAITAERFDNGRVRVMVRDDATAPRGLVGGLARGRGPLVGAGATGLIVERVVAAHGGAVVAAPRDSALVEFDLPAAP